VTIQINKPELEALIQQRLQSGGFQDVEDVLLQALTSSEFKAGPAFEKKKTQAAAARIRELRKGVSLGGLRIRDLIDEGRPWLGNYGDLDSRSRRSTKTC
jgi:hypothetical protein